MQAMNKTEPSAPAPEPDLKPQDAAKAVAEAVAKLPKEVGGAKGPEPTRYGDWAHKGRCTDF
jgi:hypothetical protein